MPAVMLPGSADRPISATTFSGYTSEIPSGCTTCKALSPGCSSRCGLPCRMCSSRISGGSCSPQRTVPPPARPGLRSGLRIRKKSGPLNGWRQALKTVNAAPPCATSGDPTRNFDKLSIFHFQSWHNALQSVRHHCRHSIFFDSRGFLFLAGET